MTRRAPRSLYTAAQSRAVDRCAIDGHGLSGSLLMARAARAAFKRLLERMPAPEALQVLCGPGNNGGDGLLVAMLAAGRNIPVRVFLVDGEPRSDDARRAAQRARAAGLTLEPFVPDRLEARGVVVDAMLGTGISGAPRQAYAAAIEAVNALDRPVLALDVPSGIDADTGAAPGEAVRATWTVSFITAKRGLYTGDGPAHAGRCEVDDLGVPAAAFAAAGDACELLDLDAALAGFPPRDAASHKGQFGRLLLVGGDHGMGGAIILAAEAALRCGVGLVRVATRAAHIPALLARRPEAMTAVVDHRNDLDGHLAWADAVVAGPGLGRGPWGEQLLQAALESERPLLLDADALNIVARPGSPSLPARCVLTPHPGEAARLLDTSVAAVQADRFAAARDLADRHGAAVVLKGQGSLVAADGRLALCSAGNPGMASAGMGDVLSGVIGALLAQGLAPGDASRLGTLLHSTAADRVAGQRGTTSLLAADLAPAIAALLP